MLPGSCLCREQWHHRLRPTPELPLHPMGACPNPAVHSREEVVALQNKHLY